MTEERDRRMGKIVSQTADTDDFLAQLNRDLGHPRRADRQESSAKRLHQEAEVLDPNAKLSSEEAENIA